MSTSNANLTSLGRPIYGATPPGGAVPCTRTTPLTPAEIAEVVELVASAREQRCSLDLPERLRTRDWDSVMAVVLGLDQRRGLTPVGWKIAAASETVRQAEGMPYPSPGRVYTGTVFPSGATLPADLFINYRNSECEFAFVLAADLPPRPTPYTESEVSAAIQHMMLVLELGDTVFLDWYGVSGYLGSCLDNGGGAALVTGPPITDWHHYDLATTRMDLYLNDQYIKSGTGEAAMGHPLTSMTWLANWLSERGIGLSAGEVVSTGTCTGHLFGLPGDTVRVAFDGLGEVTATFA